MRTPSAEPGSPPTDLWPPRLNHEQGQLLQITWDAFSEEGAWPVFDHLHAIAENRGFDALASLQGLPTILPPHYGLSWYSSHGPPQPETQIVLTVAGMSVVNGADWLVARYFQLLNAVAERWRSLPSRASEPRVLLLEYRDLVDFLGPEPVQLRLVEAIQQTLVHEPATWSGTNALSDPETWQWKVASSISRFSGISSINDYLLRTRALLGPPPTMATIPQVQTTIPLEGTETPDPLARRISAAWTSEDWDQVVRQALVFLEDRLRRLVPGSQSSSTEVVTQVLHPKNGQFPLARENLGESEGWHLMVLGLFKAIRNPVGHRLDAIQTEDEASALVGVVRLILGRLKAEYPTGSND